MRGTFYPRALYRDDLGGLYLRYDSRHWEIMTKGEARDRFGFVTLTTKKKA